MFKEQITGKAEDIKNFNKKCVVIVSGGADSVTLLYHVIKELKYSSENVAVLTFDYNQKHKLEIECVKYQVKKLNIKNHKIININFLGEFGGSSLTDKNIQTPSVEALGHPQPASYVPNRNMLMLSIATAYAESINTNKVYYGAHASDSYQYFDCTSEFVESINKILSLNRLHKIEIVAPFIDKSKTDIINIGLKLNVDYKKTWSCYSPNTTFPSGGVTPCFFCLTCLERIKSFIENNTRDPLVSEDKWGEILKK